MLKLPGNFGNLPSIFAGREDDTAMSDGIQGGFAVVGYRGKVWSLRQGGQETKLLRDDGSGPRNAIDVVVVGASHVISKTWYEQQYIEGSNAPPDCFSNNGVAPDPASSNKQSTLCGTCRHNVIGSVITPAGKKAKSCHDRKRLAVVPAGDIANDAWGGPMLLTAPPTSLAALLQFDLGMRNMGFPYYSYVTRISFDVDESYPRFVLAAVRALTDEEAVQVDATRTDPRIDRILAESQEYDAEDVVAEATAPAAKPAPAAPAASAAPAAPAARPAPAMGAQEAAPAKRPRGRPPGKAAPAPAAPAAQEAPKTAGAAFGGGPAVQNEEAAAETESAGDALEKSLDDLLDNLLPVGNA